MLNGSWRIGGSKQVPPGPGSSRRTLSAASLGTACAPALTDAVEGTLSVMCSLYVELQSHLLPLPPLKVFVADKTGSLGPGKPS